MDKLSDDLIFQILVRSPAKVVETYVAAYPARADVVRKTCFHKEFCRQSLYLQQDLALFATRVDPISPEVRKWIFRSISTVNQELPLQLCMTTLPLHDHSINKFMNYSCGLVCSGFGENPIVFNPSTGLHRVLVSASSGQKEQVRSFIGFSAKSGFNVIAISKDCCKMLSLDTMAWKPIKCSLSHRPETASVCINGIIHYAAYDTPKSMVLISFDIDTEVFHIIKIPQAPKVGTFFCEKTINVSGKAGVSFALGGDAHMVRILDNPSQQIWSEKVIKVPSCIINDIQPFSTVAFEGFTNGEIVFSQDRSFAKVMYYYNAEGDFFRKHVHQGIESSQTITFLEHVECTMFI